MGDRGATTASPNHGSGTIKKKKTDSLICIKARVVEDVYKANLNRIAIEGNHHQRGIVLDRLNRDFSGS